MRYGERRRAGDYPAGAPDQTGGDFYRQAGLGNRYYRARITCRASCLPAQLPSTATPAGTLERELARNPQTASGQVLKELEDWLHNLPGTSVDILRLSGLVGAVSSPGSLLCRKIPRRTATRRELRVHLQGWIAAVELLCSPRKADASDNIYAPGIPRAASLSADGPGLGLRSRLL